MTYEEGAMDGEAIRLRCACGWETSGTEDQVVDATQEHGRRTHNMAPTREEVLAMAAATMAAGDAPAPADPEPRAS